MHRSIHQPDRLRALFVAILIAALVCSHWQGLAHRIGHASRMLAGIEAVELAGAAVAATDAAVDATVDAATASLTPFQLYHQDPAHSCLAFDAATVGACLGTAPFVIAVPRHAPVLALWLAFISYLAPFTAQFSSRAPPHS